MTSRKKPGVAFWTTVVVVVVLVGYPLSFGPMIWIVNRGWIPGWAIPAYIVTYSPLAYFVDECRPASDPYGWYLRHFTD